MTDTTTGPRVRGDMKSIAREHGFVPLRVEGGLPPELEGTLVRTGPGLYESFGQRVAHSFEADGALMGVRLSGGKAEGAVRIVESEGLLEERRRGRPLFGSRAPALTRLSTASRERRSSARVRAPTTSARGRPGSARPEVLVARQVVGLAAPE